MILRTLILSLLGSCLAAFAAEPQITIKKGISYLPEGRQEKADLYLPKEDGQKHPGVLIIHGGGWTSGKRDAAREINIGTTLASHGYVCMSIDYLLNDPNSDKLAWPQNLHDCKTAVRWMRENAATLHLDIEHIGAIGGSAGGHLASMVGVTGPKDGLDPVGPYGNQSCKVSCVVDLYGPANVTNWKDLSVLKSTRAKSPELYRQFSVTTYLDKDDPPFLILHGTADKTVAVAHSEEFAASLAQHGIEHHLEIFPNAPHTFHLQPKERDLRPMVLAFFDKHLNKSKR